MNQEFVKLDKFDECIYTHWADKMKFLLTVLQIFYILYPLLAPIPENSVSATRKEKEIVKLEKLRTFRREDETMLWSHQEWLYDIYALITDPCKL